MKDARRGVDRIQPTEAVSQEWPIVESVDIHTFNPYGDIAIAHLWTKPDDLIEAIEGDGVETRVSITGHLYSLNGINYALRNILSNKNIGYLLVCGSDKQGSGDALVALWENGIDDSGRVIGLHEDIDFAISGIPSQSIDDLRSHVALVDMRELHTTRQVAEGVKYIIPTLTPSLPWGLPEIYEMPPITAAETLPSHWGVETVTGTSVGLNWLQILQKIEQFGEVSVTNYGNRARDIHNLVAVLEDEDPFNPQLSNYLPFSKHGLENYIAEFSNPDRPQDVFYTYGERIKRYGEEEINQLDIIKHKLTIDPNDRGAIAVLYDVSVDNRLHPSTRNIPKEDMRTPCLVLVQMNVVGNKLELTSFFRSQDMFSAWPLNILALRRMQGEVAEDLGLDMGATITITNRAHIYEHDWERLHQVLTEHKNVFRQFQQDPRGNILVSTNSEGQIIVDHIHPQTGVPLREPTVWNGKRRQASDGLNHKLASLDIIDQPAHAMYLGQQIALAEIAAKLGIPFTQDSDMIERIVAEFSRLGGISR